jgi:hypothetical protein
MASLDEVVLKQNIAAAGIQTLFVLPLPSPIARYLLYSARFHTNIISCNFMFMIVYGLC